MITLEHSGRRTCSKQPRYVDRRRCGQHARPSTSLITARRYAIAIYAMALYLSVCLSSLSVCLSDTSPCSTKMAQHRNTLTVLHNSSGSLVFWRQRSRRNSTGIDLYTGRQMQVGWVKIGDFQQITGYIAKTGV